MATVTAGVKRLIVNGQAMDVVKLGDFSVSTVKQETVEVLAGEPGVRQKPRMAYIEVEVSLRGIKTTDFVNKLNNFVHLELVNGHTYEWVDAAEVGDGKVSPEDGTLTLRYEAARAREVVQ